MKFDITDFLRRAYQEAMEEDILSQAAQVAFYFIFALFPLLLFLLSLFGIVLESANEIRDELFVYLQQIMPPSAFTLVEETLREISQSSSGGKLTLGLLIGLWSASAGLDSVRIVLNDVYDLKETRPWWKYKLTSLLLTLGIAILVFFALGVVFYGSQFIALLLSPIGVVESPVILNSLAFVVIGAVMITAFALIYNFAPNHSPFKWVWITPGAVAAIILWILFSAGFRLYLEYFDSYAKTYGSLGAMIILLLWLYLTALVILIGGVINSIAEKMSKNTEQKESDTEKKEDSAAQDSAAAG